MLQLINDLPSHVAGMHAFADVTEKEYKSALIPLFDDMVKRNGKINFILVAETDIADFASGLWCGNLSLGLKYFFKWNRVAIVTDQKKILGYSDLFKYLIPGKFRNFRLDHLDQALRWVSAK